MKRSPMPPRKTPLKRGSRLSPVGAKTRREASAVAAFRLALHVRSGGFCEARTPACPEGRHEGVHAHHIRLRSQGGGHDPANGLLVCAASHRWIHDHPAISYANGWLERRTA
jgi:hypothetical protein